MDVKRSVIVDRSPQELYTFWHDFANLARFMSHLETVEVMDNGRSHWKAKAPAGQSVEWDAEVVEDEQNSYISWRSLPGANVPNSGSVRFGRSTGDRGTLVTVEMKVDPPGGAVGSAVARLFGEDPDKQVWEDLHRFKQVMEVGEITRSDGSPDGMGSPKQRPAQPPREVPPMSTGAVGINR